MQVCDPFFWGETPRFRKTPPKTLRNGGALDKNYRVLKGSRGVQGEGVEPWITLRIPFGKIGGNPLGKMNRPLKNPNYFQKRHGKLFFPEKKTWLGVQGGPPTSYNWSYNPYKWPYKWITGVITLINGRK